MTCEIPWERDKLLGGSENSPKKKKEKRKFIFIVSISGPHSNNVLSKFLVMKS